MFRVKTRGWTDCCIKWLHPKHNNFTGLSDRFAYLDFFPVYIRYQKFIIHIFMILFLLIVNHLKAFL